jgi:O-antigen/teichoic acid export membrane protein
MDLRHGATNEPGAAFSDADIAGHKAGSAVAYAAPQTVNAEGESFGVRSARGGIIMSGMQLATATVNFAVNIALAWKLPPDTFGILAVAVSISGFVAVIRDAGVPTILIQRQSEFDRIARSVFWLTFVCAMICVVFTVVAAPITASAMKLPILIPVMLLTAVRFPVGTIGMVSSAKLMIDLRWGVLAVASVLQPIANGALAIVMAWRGWGVYSLVIPPIIGDAVRGIIIWGAANVPKGEPARWSIIAPIISSSVFIILTNVTISIRTYGDYMSLSLTRSKYETGLYFYAFVMSQALARLALASIPSVLAPVFAKLKDDENRHTSTVISAMHMFAVIGALPLALQAVLAWPLFRLFLHPKWEPSATLFAIQSLSILVGFVNNVIIQAMWANGHFRQFFKYSVVFSPGMLGAFIVGALLGGARGVAWALVISQSCEFLFFSLYALRILKVPWKAAMLPLWRPAIAIIPAGVTALALHYLLPQTKVADIERIFIVSAVGALAYCAILLLIWKHVVLTVWGHALRALQLRVA